MHYIFKKLKIYLSYLPVKHRGWVLIVLVIGFEVLIVDELVELIGLLVLVWIVVFILTIIHDMSLEKEQNKVNYWNL
jgi:hypothetical protein